MKCLLLVPQGPHNAQRPRRAVTMSLSFFIKLRQCNLRIFYEAMFRRVYGNTVQVLLTLSMLAWTWKVVKGFYPWFIIYIQWSRTHRHQNLFDIGVGDRERKCKCPRDWDICSSQIDRNSRWRVDEIERESNCFTGCVQCTVIHILDTLWLLFGAENKYVQNMNK